MPTKLLTFLLALLLAVASLPAQTRLDSRSTMHITLPEDAPISVLSADWGESNATPRGGAMLLDLHTSLVFKNTSARRIRGITLLVQAQEVTPGGKASVSVPSLNVGANETFPVRVDLRLLRPLQTGSGALVEVALDGILFDDLSFYGPNRLNSRRSMTVWELEAVRDRQYFKYVLQSRGRDSLQSEMLASLEKQADRINMDARVAQSGRSTTTRNEQQFALAFLSAPSAPVATYDGMVRVAENEARSPRMHIRNQTSRPIRAFEMGWIVRDDRGREYVAGSVPLDVRLPPHGKTVVVQDATFRFSQSGGQPIAIRELKAFLSSVEFEDGSMWVPERGGKTLTPSPEEQRLTDLYKRKGLESLIQELKKF